jgi:hypothetical protein
MPLTDAEKTAIKRQVFDAMYAYPPLPVKRPIYGSQPVNELWAFEYFTSKPLAFQRQLLIMVAERQVFTYTEGSVTYSRQERCRDIVGAVNVWGTEFISGEDFLDQLRDSTINQRPELYRCMLDGVFSALYAISWGYYLNLRDFVLNPRQTLGVNTGLFNYEKTQRHNGWANQWGVLRDFIVGTRVGETVTYGLLPHLWVEAIDAMEPTGTTGDTLQIKSPPPVYIFSLDTLPEFDKNAFVMVDLLAETPPATFQNLLATKVKSRGKSVVFNALYSQSDRQKVERRRILANPTTETYKWDNRSYTWTREDEANIGREIIYETKNYLTLSEAMTILNNL